MNYHEELLPNGLRVVIIDTKAFPSASALLLVGTGSRYEANANNGIAHFFEHMAFKGSSSYPDAMTLSSTVEGVGGEFNAFTSKEYTGYWIKAPTKHIEIMTDVLADMVQRPLLKEDEIEKEKGVIVEEINMYEDMPARKVAEVYDSLLYKTSPLGFDTLGTKDTVTSFTRETFNNYLQSYYYPNNSVFVIAGGLSDFKNSKELIKEKFGKWGKTSSPTYTKYVDTQNKPEIAVHTKKTEQAHFVLGFRSFSYFDKRKPILNVLATLLGGGMSSRLFHEVRERRGLCYYISTERDSYADTGTIYTRAGVATKQSVVEEAIQVTLDQHSAVAEGDINDVELTRAKELLKGRIILSLEDSFSTAYFFGKRKLTENKVESLESVLESIEKVTKEQVTKLANELFVSSKLNIAVVGPFEKVKFDFNR